MDDIKLVIFDLDGTLVDAHRAIIKSVNFTLSKCGYPKQADSRILKAVGWGDRKLLGAFIVNKDIERALVIYRSHHRKTLKQYSRLLPYAQATLIYLVRRKHKLAIASNRPTVFTNIILRYLKIRKYFDYILCSDKLSQGKPHPEILLKIINILGIMRKQTVYVGDMAIDVEAGRRAGIKAITVRGGLSTLEEIKRARPFKTIKNLASLKSYL